MKKIEFGMATILGVTGSTMLGYQLGYAMVGAGIGLIALCAVALLSALSVNEA
jgi:hypothetical protein